MGCDILSLLASSKNRGRDGRYHLDGPRNVTGMVSQRSIGCDALAGPVNAATRVAPGSAWHPGHRKIPEFRRPVWGDEIGPVRTSVSPAEKRYCNRCNFNAL